jgi:hypothetical protein
VSKICMDTHWRSLFSTIDKHIRLFSNKNFRTPSNFQKCLKSIIGVGGNWCQTNTKTHFIDFSFTFFVLVWHQLSPIPILLFEHFRKREGVWKFQLEKLSYLLVYDPRKNSVIILNHFRSICSNIHW